MNLNKRIIEITNPVKTHKGLIRDIRKIADAKFVSKLNIDYYGVTL